MIKLLHLDYVALIVYALMLIALLLRTRKSSRRRSVFAVMLLVAVLADVYDICSVSLDNHGPGGVVLKYICNIGYLVLRNLITPLFGAYIITVADTWHRLYKKELIKYLIWVPFGIVSILTLISPYTHGVFYIDQSGYYTRGPQFFVLYASAIFYMLFCIGYGCINYKLIGKDRLIPILSIVPFQLLAVVIQLLFPDILCEMIATSLCLLLVMLTIEKPEEKVDLSTGLLKSNAFMDMVIQAKKVDRPYCVVLISLSNFASLNSYLSHTNMEIAYSVISKRLDIIKSHLHINPDIFFLENGMFAAVLNGEDISYGPRYAQHILDTLKHSYSANGLSVSLMPNVCVIKSPEDTNDIDKIRLIIKDLRNTKYLNEVILASSLMKRKDYTVLANIDGILSNAIENDGFEVYYQPIYSTVDQKFNSAEALIRLNTKEYGFIRPDLFIPMAEESGAINQIGMIVFEKVCQFIASDTFKKLGLDYIEVNLSVVQCMDRDIVSKIMSMCEKYNVSPSKINLEITETASSYEQKNMKANINALNSNGFSFSLDDFGTGYSNMVRIASLPLSIVKLDKSFTRTDNNRQLELILNNTISMVKRMNMKIVVEGVETKEMLDNFTSLGCEYIQGFYFSKPLPEYDFINYISDHNQVG